MHGHVNGVLSGLDGGSYQQGFLSTASSSILSSVVGDVMQNIPGLKSIATYATGGITNGLMKKSMGGSFWRGFGEGAIMATVNHLADHMLLPSQPWDLNGDGKLQKYEADIWWMKGKGADVWIDNSKIDWRGLEMSSDVLIGGEFQIQTSDAFIKLAYETAATYGGTTFIRRSETTAEVQDQLYHYKYRSYNSIENILRNIATYIGYPESSGIDFMIRYYNRNINFSLRNMINYQAYPMSQPMTIQRHDYIVK